jgi:4-alpha-glucanotransferase
LFQDSLLKKAQQMKINFYLRFQTALGESLRVKANIQNSGDSLTVGPVPMQYLNEEFWQASIEVDTTKARKIQYLYTLVYGDGNSIDDGERERVIDLSEIRVGELWIIDTWNHEGTYENVFYTSPFQKILLAEYKTESNVRPVKVYTHIFKVKAPLLRKNEVLFLSGSSIELGSWNKEDSLFMTKEGNWWTVKVSIPDESFPVEYKYGIYNTKENKFIGFEGFENRRLYGVASAAMVTILHDGFARFPNNTWRGAGVAVPVFSLKTAKSFGVGEFNDLKGLADWAKEVGLKLIQILPVNDTTATHTFLDSYPYAAISAFALHPIYINLDKVAGKKQPALTKQLESVQKQLNALPELDYEQVMKTKWEALKELCAAQKEECLNDADFQAFFTKDKHWLVPYAAFCYLRDQNGTADFSQWNEYGVYDKEAIENFVSPEAKQYDEIFLHYFIQYHLHLQLKEATEYAHKNGIIIKGDIPIGIYRHSCDAWMSPELYNMDMQAGAPPDIFAVKGQNWGFPTYNWHKMEEDGFAWWHQRFEQMSNYFDAFRIDHILGFFRIWSVPIHAVEGIMGFFVPAIPVHLVEFSEKNLWFDRDRYTKPFITGQVLYDIFGEAAGRVKQEYLNELSADWYGLKEAFNTQRKVEDHFKKLEQNEENEKLKIGLFDLISNVILFEVEGSNGTQFHFRISMENTTSFKNLYGDTQNGLKELYVNYFFRRQDAFWKKEAMKKLPALKAATNMLICGEDLGMVPHCVPEVMQELGILSLEIQRMPKDTSREFFHPADAPYLSVVTPSTHDMSTVRGWWEEDRGQTQRFFNHELGHWGTAPFYCEPWVNKAVILQHLHSPAMWSIFQLQDLFGMSDTLRRENPEEERINVPANPKHYWRYRTHFTLEELQKADAFNEDLKKYIRASER